MNRLFAVGTTDELDALISYFVRTNGAPAQAFAGGHRVESDAVVQIRRVTQLYEPKDYDPAYETWKLKNLPITPGPGWLRKPVQDAEAILECYGQLVTWASAIYSAAEDDRRTNL